MRQSFAPLVATTAFGVQRARKPALHAMRGTPCARRKKDQPRQKITTHAAILCALGRHNSIWGSTRPKACPARNAGDALRKAQKESALAEDNDACGNPLRPWSPQQHLGFNAPESLPCTQCGGRPAQGAKRISPGRR